MNFRNVETLVIFVPCTIFVHNVCCHLATSLSTITSTKYRIQGSLLVNLCYLTCQHHGKNTY